MVRLRRITTSGFRGARYPLMLDLTGSCRSIAIFGENASGKSTITDAIEWFFKDRVEHLWREDCKQEALRNVCLDDKEDGLVALEFNNTEISCEKRLTKSLAAVESNKSQEFKDYKARAADERLVLRTAYLTEFINKRKGEKRTEIAHIIGYEALVEFRKLILSGLNSVEKDPDFTNAKRNQEAAQAKLMKLAGEVIVSENEFFARANQLVSQFQPKIQISDEESYLRCIEELKGKIGQQQKAEKRIKFGELKQACESLARAVKTACDSEEKFLEPYSRLVESKEKVKLLDIEQFLSKGKEILDKDLAEPQKCPFCGTEPVDLDHVKEEVARRIQELSSLRKEYQATGSARAKWVSDLREVNRRAVDIEKKWAGLDVTTELATLVRNAATDTIALADLVEKKFGQYQPISQDPGRKQSANLLIESLEGRVKKADLEVEALVKGWGQA